MIVNLPIKWKIKDQGALTEEARNYFKEHKRLKPVRFGYTTSYAESLEYGTGPLSQRQDTVEGGNYSWDSIYKGIYEWAGKKDGKGSGLPIKNKQERAEFAKAVTDKFFREGMKPHPYFRPAVQWLEDNEQALFDKGYSLFEIADEALRIANRCIMIQNLPFNGKLQLSAFLDEIDWREIGGDGKDLSEYNEDERNRLFRDSGWSESHLMNENGQYKKVKKDWRVQKD